MSVTFPLPRRFELKLAKLADAREERERLNEKIEALESDLFTYAFNSVLAEAEARGKFPAGPFLLTSDELQATYVCHDSSTPLLTDELAHQIDASGIEPSMVAQTRSVATLASSASDKPKAVAAVVLAAKQGIQGHAEALGEHFTSKELAELVQVATGKYLVRGRIQKCSLSLVDLWKSRKVDEIQQRVKALRLTQYLKFAS